MEQFESSDYASDHLKGLNDLRKQGLFCDVTIIIGDRPFQAHKVVLCASSTYFNAMFTSGFQESRNSEVKIGIGSAEVFEELLEFAYTGRSRVSPETICGFLHLACYMDFKYAIGASANSLKKRLDEIPVADCIDLYNLAQCHKDVRPLVDKLMRIKLVKKFVAVVQTDSFMSSVDKDFLVFCLAIPEIEIYIHNEEKLFQISLDWLFHDWENRKWFAFDVLKKIRLGLIPTDSVDRMRERLKPILDIPKCRELFERVVNLQENNSLVSLKHCYHDLFATRHTKKVPVLTEVHRGTVSLHIRSNGHCFRFQKAPRFPGSVCTDLDTIERFGHGYSILAVAGEVYVAGGIWGVHYDQIHPNSDFYKYNPDTNEWCFLPRMPASDCYPLLVEMDSYIYAIGCSSERHESRNARRFNIATYRWESVEELNLDLNDTSGVACNGYLLVAGSNRVRESNPPQGFVDNLYVYVTAYDPDIDRWTKVYQSHILPWMIPRGVSRQYPVQIFVYDGFYYFQSIKFQCHKRHKCCDVVVEEVIFESTDPESLLFMLGEEVDQIKIFGALLTTKNVVQPSQLISIDVRDQFASKTKWSVISSCLLPHSKKNIFSRAKAGW